MQRVSEADVTVEGQVVGNIQKGLLVLISVEDADDQNDVDYMAEKIINLRIFEDDAGKMNESLFDINGEILVVSQFTLHGDCRKGRRPSFIQASRPEKAIELYEAFIQACKEKNIKTKAGTFQAEMQVRLCNEGPVTLLVDSKKIF